MNLVLLFEGDLVNGPRRVCLAGRRMEHVVNVLHARVGDSLQVGRLGGMIGRGVIAGMRRGAIELEVTLGEAPPPALPLTLLLALPRPKSLKRVVQTITTMGVKRVFLLNTVRVEKSFWNSPVLEPEVLRQQMILALEQACDTVLPEIELRRRFKPFVEDELPSLVRGTRALVAHPAAKRPCPRSVAGAVTLAIGPEGGFVPYEVELLQAAGFEPVSLGPRRLRVEQAVPALLGRLF
jgi:16S rRNA (uracil1498-N3)-methyltransferase